MILMTFNNSFFFQFPNLGGQTAAVNFKIVGKLLTIVGNVKAVAASLFGFLGKVGHDLIARGALRDHLDFLVKENGFAC